ncbi:MAG: hypothetical protein E7628_02955 [Ruminococcaceae bacterium]|nr:hypothetical protein [Oscillospiraceae bacterium]
MKIFCAVFLLIMLLLSAANVYADIALSPDAPTLPPDLTSPINGDNIVLIITVLCLSGVALVALIITSIIIKRKK